MYYVGGSSAAVSFPPQTRTDGTDHGRKILSGKVPYYYLPREGQVLLELQNGNKPRRPQEGHMNDVLWDKINECWEDNPNERPTSDNVARFLMRQFKLETSVRSH